MEITMDELRSLIACQNAPPNVTPFEIGRAYMIRTVTMHLTGRVKAIVGQFLVLSDAAWIADSGRYHKSLKDGVVEECEPFVDDAIVGLGVIVDATPWTGELPRKAK